MLQNNSNSRQSIVVGTRGSLLARSQTALVISQLQQLNPGLEVQTLLISSSGDKIQDRPLHEFGGKGLFTKELETALLAGQIDLAVHSLKDVPVTMPLVDQQNLCFAAIPLREDPRDILASLKYRYISDLPQGTKVGTGSLRRRCQLLAARPDLQVEMIRGNIDTRLRKMREGQYDAVILAYSGVKRANLFNDKEMTPIPFELMLPAAGQGALLLQCRKDDTCTREIVAKMDDPTTHTCIEAERALVMALNGDCHSPIAAYATLKGDQLTLAGALGQSDGRPPVKRGSVTGSVGSSKQLAESLAGQLR